MKKLLGVLALAFFVVLVMGTPRASAATESVYVEVWFNIGAVDELTVTLLGQSAVTSATGGTATPANIEFNSSDGSDEWVNATVAGGGSEQDDTNPILSLDNTGTTNLGINMSLNETLGDTCLNLTYDTSHTYSPTKYVNSTMNATLDTSFTPAESAISVWLWGNFSTCGDADDYVGKLMIWAKTV